MTPQSQEQQQTYTTMELVFAAIARLSHGDRLKVLRFVEFILQERQKN